MTRIAVFDSGIGGTGVLREIRLRAPQADIVYLADHAFGPYGERTLDEVRGRTELVARYLSSSGVEMAVIACNSASAASLHYLRDTIPGVEFVGMEPAVKPAAEMTRTGVVAVLATGATFQGELFKNLVGRFSGGVEIFEQACPGLAKAVEDGAPPDDLLDQFLPPVVESGADVVVLGCTHYPLIADEIAARLPDSVTLIDPAPAVASQVVAIADDRAFDLKGAGSTAFWTTAVESPRADGHLWESIDMHEDALAAIRVGGTSVTAVVGDITQMPVAAVVNAANTHLRHGGGVALAIAEAGGEVVVDESNAWVAEHGPLSPGTAALTSGGSMPARYVIHVAGPIYGENQDNEALLTSAVVAALATADAAGATSLAIPAISAGVYGYPADEATRVVAEATTGYLSEVNSSISSCRLVGFDAAMGDRFRTAIGAQTATD